MPQHIIEVTPALGPNGQVRWNVCKPGSQPQENVCTENPASYPVIDVARGSNDNVVHIKITNDTTGRGIKFAPDPLWVQAGTKPTCPVIDSQISHVAGAGSKNLIFRDANTNDEELVLKYQLNFVDQTGQGVTAIDPDIKNGGGGGGGNLDAAWILVVAAIGGAILSLLVARFALGWRAR